MFDLERERWREVGPKGPGARRDEETDGESDAVKRKLEEDAIDRSEMCVVARLRNTN